MRPPLIFFLSTLFSFSFAIDTINPTTPLTDGQTLVSSGGSFVLGFFSPSGSSSRYIGIWYDKVSIQTVVWVANRQVPVSGSAGTLSISSVNASLSVTDDAGKSNSTVWFTPAADNITNPVAQLLDDGNLVVREEGNQDPTGYAWQSFDHPTDTLLSEMKLGLDRRSRLNRNLTAWTSGSDPSPGPYSVAVDARGDPQIFLWSGGRRSWRTGPWSGVEPSGIPELMNYGSLFSYESVDSSDEVYLRYHIVNSSVISRLVLNQSGHLQRLVWLASARTWKIYWYAPKDECDAMSACGPYGVCDANASPICRCLQGFKPKSPEKWALRDGTDGCVRRTALDCRNGTDGIVMVAGAKVPDTTTAAVDPSMGLDQCRTACLSNCSCKAYTSANASGGGSGCIIWTAELTDIRVYTYGGQDVYVRLAAADLGPAPKRSKKKRSIAAIVVVISGILIALLIGCIGYCLLIKKKKKKRYHLHPGPPPGCKCSRE